MKDDLSSYFEDPEFKETLAKYEGMVENHTPAYFDVDELTDIAEYYASKGRHDDADKVIDLALELHPNDTDALIFRSRSLALHGQLEEANKVASQIEDSTDREVKFLQADLLMEENRIEEADAIFNQLAINEEEELDTLLDIMLAHIDANQQKYAEKWLLRIGENYDVVELPTHHQRYRDVICDYYITFNNPAMAIPLLRMALDELPYSIPHWCSLGGCQLQLGNYEEAHEALDFALAIDDKNEEAMTLKAFCYRQNDNQEEACKYYQKLVEISENKVAPYLSLAQMYLEKNNFDSALSYLEILLEKKSKLSNYERAELYCDVAVCYASLDRSAEGSEYIFDALSLNGEDPNVRIAAGRFFLIDKREELALTQFNHVLQSTPEDERYSNLFHIASTCFDVNNKKLATQYFEQINKEFPEDAKSTYFFLIYCYFYLQEVTPCLHYIAKLKAEVPEFYENLGYNNELAADQKFNTFISSLKEKIKGGEINLDHDL